MDTSYLTQQVTTIIGQLHNLFDEIGVPSHERDSRESELFSSLSETLHNHLRIVSNEKNEMIEEAQRIITTIRQMEASLDDTKPNGLYAPKEDDLSVTYPLTDCLETLKIKHKTVGKLHQERYEQIKKLLQALESYSSHLETSFIQIKLPPVSADGTIPSTFDLSPSYINSVDSEFTRVYEEYTRRAAIVHQTAEDIVKLWAELGTPQAQIDETIVGCWRDSPEQLGLHEDDMSRLRARRERLLEEKRVREKHLKEMRATVESLWDRLGVSEQDRKAFLAGNRGCALRTINDLEDELSRLNDLKRQNLHLFVEDARAKLQKLWDELYISEEEAVEFTPVFCDVFSDALLSAHEAEIARLETLREQRAPTLQLIARHRSLIKDREDLAASSQDASRLMLKPQKGEKRDPTRLLREEKMRKRITKELPKVEQELRKVLEQWEDEYGRPFLVFGERYLDGTVATATTNPLPPRSKTPNVLPATAKLPKSLESSSRSVTLREPSTLRSKTPVASTHRITAASTRSTTSNKSPSRIPARVPLGPMLHGSNSPDRLQAQKSDSSKGKDSSTGKVMIAAMAPPPKMRDVRTMPSQSAIAPTPNHTLPCDFSRSGSVVRHIPPEDPYSDHERHCEQRPRFIATPSLQRPQSQLQGYRAMPPPPRPVYHESRQLRRHDFTDHAVSTTSSMPSSVASCSSSRQISTTSTATAHSTAVSGNENWESYEDAEGNEAEVEASDAYWRAMQVQQQAKAIGTGFGKGLGGGAFNAGVGGTGIGPRRGNGWEVSETGWTDEDGIDE